jgi:hypothetical protein
LVDCCCVAVLCFLWGVESAGVLVEEVTGTHTQNQTTQLKQQSIKKLTHNSRARTQNTHTKKHHHLERVGAGDVGGEPRERLLAAAADADEQRAAARRRQHSADAREVLQRVGEEHELELGALGLGVEARLFFCCFFVMCVLLCVFIDFWGVCFCC